MKMKRLIDIYVLTYASVYLIYIEMKDEERDWLLKDHDACLKGDGTGCPHALAWVLWSHEDGEMHRIG